MDRILYSLFECAIGWELKAKDLYEQYAVIFGEYKQVRGFWLQMADDEAAHARILNETRVSIKPEELNTPVSRKTWSDVARVNMLVDEVSRTRIRHLDDAHDLAHRLEISELNSIFRLLAINLVPDKKREDMLAHQIDQHLERLYIFGRTISRENRAGIVV